MLVGKEVCLDMIYNMTFLCKMNYECRVKMFNVYFGNLLLGKSFDVNFRE